MISGFLLKKKKCCVMSTSFQEISVLLLPRFHPMVESSSSILKFVNSVILFLRNHNFDGLDISWIYPNVKDNTHFTVLVHVRQTPCYPYVKRIAIPGGKNEETGSCWKIVSSFQKPQLMKEKPLDLV